MITSTSLIDPAGIRARRQTAIIPLARPFWFGLGTLVVVILLTAHPQNAESACGAAMIIAAASLPAALWTMKQMPGLPVFPVFCLTHIWAFGLPLLYEHPIVILFEPDSQLVAALSVTGFLLLGTTVWYRIRAKSSIKPRRCLTIESHVAETVFLSVLPLGILFTLAVNAWWLGELPKEAYSIVRAVMLALEALSAFVLSHRLGSGQLKGPQAWLFKLLFVGLIVASLPTLFLVTAISLVGVATLGYVSASGKVPWISLIIAAMIMSFLHAGKADMREQYWAEESEGSIQPWEYPAFFAQWIESSTDALFGNIPESDEKGQSIVERASLMQLLLYEQDVSPSVIPFMYGETYFIVPQLLIPRILYPDKPTSHEGTYLLNMHFGFQTREQTQHTTIGFGLLNESYANLGFVGMAVLAVVLGAFYGFVERLAMAVPLLSLRGLFAVLVACYAFQVEFAAGVWITAIFQSSIALLALSLFLMKSRPLESTVGLEESGLSGDGALSTELRHA